MTQFVFMVDIYAKINEHLSAWIKLAESKRKFATDHNIDEKTVRLILKGDIEITIKTLERICEARNLKLSDYFELIKR